MRLNSTMLFGGAAAVSLAVVGAALVTQHVFGMQPCPWCVLQRLIFVTVALAALLGLLGVKLRSGATQWVAAALMLALAACGAAAAVWQHFVAAASQSCNLTLADRTYTCSHCGLVMDRDRNAAWNILARGRAALAGLALGRQCLPSG